VTIFLVVGLCVVVVYTLVVVGRGFGVVITLIIGLGVVGFSIILTGGKYSRFTGGGGGGLLVVVGGDGGRLVVVGGRLVVVGGGVYTI